MVNGEKLTRDEAIWIAKYVDKRGPLERLEARRVGKVTKTKNLTRREDGNFGCFEHDGEHRFKFRRAAFRGYKGSLLMWQSSCGERLSPREWWENLLTFGHLRGTVYDPIPPPPTPMERIATALEAQQARPLPPSLPKPIPKPDWICEFCDQINRWDNEKCSLCSAPRQRRK